MEQRRRLAAMKRIMNVRENQHLLQQWRAARAQQDLDRAMNQLDALARLMTAEHAGGADYALLLRQQERRGHAREAGAVLEKAAAEDLLRQMSLKLEQARHAVRRREVLAAAEAELRDFDALLDEMAQRRPASSGPA